MSKLSSHHPFLWFSVFADGLRARKGLRRFSLALTYGALAALAFPPFNLIPLFWLCFPALIFLLQGTTNMRQAFVTGWSFAFGFMVLSFYWIAGALFVDIKQFWWILPLAVCGLPACMAIYYGFAAALARKIGLKGVSGTIVFSLLWFAAEYARGHLFTGFPWDIAGYIWADVLPVLQITSIIGVYGLTLLTLAVAALPACLTEKNKNNRFTVIGSLVFLTLIAVWGGYRLMQDQGQTVPNVRLRLVQPSIDQKFKWINVRREENFKRLLDLSSAPSEKPPTHIIWPETAATFYLAEEEDHRQPVAKHVPAAGSVLTGVVRRSLDADNRIHYYNSLIAIDGRARVVAGYDKSHLVPFGEYIPMRHFLPSWALSAVGMDFSSGDGPHTLRVLGLPSFSPLICYEIIFPGEVSDPGDPPQFLLNITNDAWYNHTTGPYQHFAIARVRAVEEGLPLVRAANMGVTGVVDPYGRSGAKIGWEHPGFIDSDLPKALSQPTMYGRYRDIPLALIFICLVLVAFYGKIRRVR